MKDLLFFGGTALCVVFGAALLNALRHALAARSGITLPDDSTTTERHYDAHDDDVSMAGKVKFGSITDDDGVM